MGVAQVTYAEAEKNLREAIARNEDSEDHYTALRQAAQDRKYAVAMPDVRKCIFCGVEKLWDSKEMIMWTIASMTQHAHYYDVDTDDIIDIIYAPELTHDQRPVLDCCKNCITEKGFGHLLMPDLRAEREAVEKPLVLADAVTLLKAAVAAKKFKD